MSLHRNRLRYQRRSERALFVILSAVFLLLIFYVVTLYDLRKQKDQLGLYDERVRMKRFTKVIATWNTYWGDHYFNFGSGYEPFQRNNCTVHDCYIIHDRGNEVIEKYDAVLFHGPDSRPEDYPSKRSDFQRYIYFNEMSPVQNKIPSYFNDFFNMTMTYRLDSDIVLYQFSFYDLDTNEMISPNRDPQWFDKIINEAGLTRFEDFLPSKWRPVVWDWTDGYQNGNQERKIQELKKYIDVDVFGEFGDLQCPDDTLETCPDVFGKEYYFQIIVEESNCVDYVAKSVGTAFANNLVPIYFGGGDLSRFAPPNSYIDAKTLSVKELADTIQRLMNNTKEYLEYFWWKDYYKVVVNTNMHARSFCSLCELLHRNDLSKNTYEDFHYWWYMYDGLPACEKNR